MLFCRYYFQLLSPDTPVAYGFHSIIKHFNWRKVGIITQGENLFIAVSLLYIQSIVKGVFNKYFLVVLLF